MQLITLALLLGGGGACQPTSAAAVNAIEGKSVFTELRMHLGARAHIKGGGTCSFVHEHPPPSPFQPGCRLRLRLRLTMAWHGVVWRG